MSKATYISRYAMILKRLKTKPFSSYEDLKLYFEKESDYLNLSDSNLSIAFSKRTLQRDLREIRNLFGIEITYSKPNKGYFIEETESENLNFQRMIESFEIFHSFTFAEDAKQFILLEKVKPQGTEHLYGILHAIKNNLQISFDYHKFWEAETTKRKVNPYALKEFKNRWYLLAVDVQDKKIKTFGLDRISELQIKQQKFARNSEIDVQKIFKHSFGIISPTNEKPNKVILSFDPEQGKYIKTLPLHESQTIITDSKKELRISLLVYDTHDLFMELLSFGSNVNVIEPKALAKKIKAEHLRAAAV